MNANELADKLSNVDVMHKCDGDIVNNAKAMLRQQQARLEKLQELNREYTALHMRQQAEIAELKHMNKNWQISENILLLELEKLQQRELTDEEITEIYNEILIHDKKSSIKFARAILRKAQEK